MKKGFTLIELLAVIVILAIISLIATPIVLNIINEAKESARLRSAEFYIDGVEYAISKRILEGKTIEDGIYSILQSGNICIGTLQEDKCIGDILEVNIDGERPNGEKITIKDGQIVSHVIKYGDVVVKSEEVIVGSATFSDGTTLTWDELKLPENGDKYGYDASVISDTAIGRIAFVECRSLTSIAIPTGVTTIGEGAFAQCVRLTSIAIPDSVTTIGDWAFQSCTSLATVFIGSGVDMIGQNIFNLCPLTNITFNGTIAEWNEFVKNISTPATATITCTDGTITIPANPAG